MDTKLTNEIISNLAESKFSANPETVKHNWFMFEITLNASNLFFLFKKNELDGKREECKRKKKNGLFMLI